MSPADLLPAGPGWVVLDTNTTADAVTVALAANAPAADCPACGRPSDRVHSRYRRTLADLPVGGRRLVLRVTARRFFCRQPGCPRAVFCERLPRLTAAHARATGRLADLHRAVGFLAGGEPGSRLAGRLAAPASGDTILRRVHTGPAEPEPVYRYVGIDDFALRKGHTYGTILIDLERGRVIDILDGRDGAAVESWLRAHPGVEVITRDRWPGYANAATAGAPNATQVADRFHLVCNLREVVERLLHQHAAAIDAAIEPLAPPAPPAAPGPEPPAPPVPPDVAARRQRRQDRFAQVRRLRAAGQSLRQIARAMGMSPRTVLVYLRRERCPDWNLRIPRATRLDGLRDVVDGFIRDGGRTAAELFRRLRGRGCRASRWSWRMRA